MGSRHTHLIDGHGSDSVADAPIVNPATEIEIGRVALGTKYDIDDAVAAARRAFGHWSSRAPAARGEVLDRLATALEQRRDAIVAVHAAEVGTPAGAGALIHARATIETARNAAELTRTFAFEEALGTARVQKMPVGVVAAITPWNVPLQLAVAKVMPALAAGCTVVLKPSELTAGCTAILIDAVTEAGVPAGVVNVVQGDGIAGAALAGHPGIDMVSFTGSARVGREIGRGAGERMTRMLLELGGKSASIILDDADVEHAATHTARQVFLNSGQGCIAWSRLLVPYRLLDAAVAAARQTAEALVLGDPAHPGVTMGPLVTRGHRDRVGARVALALAAGARLVTGGGAGQVPQRGWFYPPTVLCDVENAMAIAREEVFGPVLCIIGYDGSDDAAVALADDSDYGLHGAVFSGDPDRARAVARRLRTGQVTVNSAHFEPAAPFGGFRQSGVGRQGGPYGLAAYLELKTLHL